MVIGCRLKVNGIVQGVGFRPFIHKQTVKYGIRGWVRNTSSGAELDLEGEEENIGCFISDLWTCAPQLSVIESVEQEKYDTTEHYTDFRIIASKREDSRNTLISPDVCICDDCLEELFDPNNKRYRYPFINCTNCGPRFTIIKDVPYDRPKTTMSAFPMCAECAHEYADIEDRRYHAQPVCCPECGPELMFLDGSGRKLSDGRKSCTGPEEGDPIRLAQKALKDGKIVAIKGLGGIHLACRFDDPKIPKLLRSRKHRDEKPFAIMVRDVDTAKRFCAVSPEEEKILTGIRRPIVLLKKREASSFRQISENGYIGIMLPYTPVHYLLFDKEGGIDALVMTSANLSDLPIMFRNDEAIAHLKGIADAFLLNDRDIHVRADDSLLWVHNGQEYPARRSRGYVPFPVVMKKSGPSVLALGAEQKASFCVTKGNYAFPSQHIGDLKNIETYENYEAQIGHFENMFDIRPSMLISDLHPDYLSTEYAVQRSEEEGLPLLQVQHHYAHMCSCMADNDIRGPVIGVIWDGTGLGTDGTIWGGEFLTGDFNAFCRDGHISPVRLPGGDVCAEEITRVAVSLLKDAGLWDDPFVKDLFDPEEAERICALLDMDINCPGASSMGRLFDGICALTGIKRRASYEGQGAVLLEAAASEGVNRAYTAKIAEGVFLYKPMLSEIIEDMKKGVHVSEIAACFMNTLVEMALSMCIQIRNAKQLNRVVLSGGCFQNMYMLSRLELKLKENGFDVFCHRRVSANDEGISLGQAMIGMSRQEKENVSCSTT